MEVLTSRQRRTFILTLLLCITCMIEPNGANAHSEAAPLGGELAEPAALLLGPEGHGGGGGRGHDPGGGHGQGPGAGHGHAFTEADIEVSCMLLGGVALVLGLFYLVNYEDEDIRRYSWKIISTTISIFLAVLLFQAINEFVLMFVEGCGEIVVCAMQFLHCLVYIVALQMTIAIISGAICEKQMVDLDQETWVISDPLRIDYGVQVREDLVRNRGGTRSVILDSYDMEVPVRRQKVELAVRKRNMKCFARLLAHVAGFAAINAGGTLQQLEAFSRTPLLALCPVAITELFLMAVFWPCSMIRQVLKVKAMKSCSSKVSRVDMWSEEVFDAEVDISSLSMSFLAVQVIRFALTHDLPNEHGEEVPEQAYGLDTIILLYFVGFVFLFVAIVLIMRRANADEEEETLKTHLKLTSLNASAMAFAWCLLWATRWACIKAPAIDVASIMGRVVMALMLSAAAGLAVFALDTVDDMHRRGRNSRLAGQAISVLVTALGLLIGFSWEHCFHGGVEAVASLGHDHSKALQMVMGYVIAGAMTPMWRRYILTKELAMQELKEEKEAAVASRSARAERELLAEPAPPALGCCGTGRWRAPPWPGAPPPRPAPAPAGRWPR